MRMETISNCYPANGPLTHSFDLISCQKVEIFFQKIKAFCIIFFLSFFHFLFLICCLKSFNCRSNEQPQKLSIAISSFQFFNKIFFGYVLFFSLSFFKKLLLLGNFFLGRNSKRNEKEKKWKKKYLQTVVVDGNHFRRVRHQLSPFK